MKANTTRTIKVSCHASWRVGQETLRNSPTVSRVNRWIAFCFLESFLVAKPISLLTFLRLKRRLRADGVAHQAGQEGGVLAERM